MRQKREGGVRWKKERKEKKIKKWTSVDLSFTKNIQK